MKHTSMRIVFDPMKREGTREMNKRVVQGLDEEKLDRRKTGTMIHGETDGN